ncbi:uncharacterized protein [Antedon mediterranea]|uniref:uncharacterized protein n=1 Tax=Antedon mediterranea TaxID=105859 RepID=UPI003AF638E1
MKLLNLITNVCLFLSVLKFSGYELAIFVEGAADITLDSRHFNNVEDNSKQIILKCEYVSNATEPNSESSKVFIYDNSSSCKCKENASILEQIEELSQEIGGLAGVNQSKECLRMSLAVEGLTNYLVSDKAVNTRFAETAARDCNDIQRLGYNESGVYTILPHDCGPAFQVYCDLETMGGGWTVIQRRQDGSVGFYRGYGSYRRGFGNVNGEFWLGNQNMHRITDQDEYELLIELWDFNDTKVYARYDGFYIGSHHSKFRLELGKYIGGDAGDSLSYHSGNPFSTKDRDHDMIDYNCALNYGGGWWYLGCHYSNLNGLYLIGETELFGKGIVWYDFRGQNYSLKKTEMKIRIKDYKAFLCLLVSLLNSVFASNVTDTFLTIGQAGSFDISSEVGSLARPHQPFHQTSRSNVSNSQVLEAVEKLSIDIRTQLSECSGGRIRQLEQAVLDLSSVLKVFVNQGQTKVSIERPRDCTDHLLNGKTKSDVYFIYPDDCGSPFEVFCDMTTDGGGWTIFQRRQDGQETFYRGFGSYRRGFGNIFGEFWLGLDKIRRLTILDEYELRVDLKDFDSNTAHAKYGRFRVGSLEEDFRLFIDEYSGTAGDAMILHNHQRFSTFDRDNDAWTGHCAEEYSGAWWYESCHFTNLNGVYLNAPGSEYAKGVVWRQWRGYEYSLKFVEMKIRRKN